MGGESGTSAHAPTYVLLAKDWTIGLTLMIGSVIAGLIGTVVVFLSVPTRLVPVWGMVASGIGVFVVVAVYFFVSDKSLSYIDIPDFSARAIGIGILVGLVLTAVQAGLTFLFLSLGIGEPVGAIGQLVQARGIGFLATVIAVNLVLIAPAEELLYRNGIQKLLYRSHSTAFAVIGGAVIFTLPHMMNLVTSSFGEIATGLFEIFINGLGYGAVYAYWRRLDITIVAHALYNCAVFVFAYLHVFGG